MTILYTVICRIKDVAILVEVCDSDIKGTFSTIMIELLQHLHKNNTTENIIFNDGDCKTFIQQNTEELDFFSHFLEACNNSIYNTTTTTTASETNDGTNDTENHYFHLYYKNGIYYCCLSDDSDLRDQKVNFTFLMSIEKEFTKMFRTGRIQTANAYSLSNNFTPTIRSSMHYHNIHMKELRQEEHVQALRVKVDTIRTIMGRNINMILDRGTKIDTLLARSDSLNKDAQVFKKKSKQAKHMMQRKYYFWYATFAFILIVFLYMTVVSTCGIRLEYCRASSSSQSNSNNSNSSSNSNSDNSYNNNSDEGGESNQANDGGN